MPTVERSSSVSTVYWSFNANDICSGRSSCTRSSRSTSPGLRPGFRMGVTDLSGDTLLIFDKFACRSGEEYRLARRCGRHLTGDLPAGRIARIGDADAPDLAFRHLKTHDLARNALLGRCYRRRAVALVAVGRLQRLPGEFNVGHRAVRTKKRINSLLDIARIEYGCCRPRDIRPHRSGARARRRCRPARASGCRRQDRLRTPAKQPLLLSRWLAVWVSDEKGAPPDARYVLCASRYVITTMFRYDYFAIYPNTTAAARGLVEGRWSIAPELLNRCRQ